MAANRHQENKEKGGITFPVYLSAYINAELEKMAVDLKLQLKKKVTKQSLINEAIADFILAWKNKR
jgi:hypothetical protein